MQREDYAQKNFLKKIRKVFVNRNGNVVTLQSEMGKAAASPREGQGRAAPRKVLYYPLVPSRGKGVRRTGKGSFRSSFASKPFQVRSLHRRLK